MQVTNIAGKEFTTIASIKAFALEQGMSITGSSKWLKSQWVEKLESFMKVKAEVIAIAVDAEEVSQDASEQIETAVVSVGSLIVAALTSEQAIGFYRQSLKFVGITIVITWMFAVKAAEWCWENRDRTAVYHWVEAWLDSPQGKGTIAYGLIVEWVVASWIESLGHLLNDIHDRVSAGFDRLVGWVGIGGGAVEIQ